MRRIRTGPWPGLLALGVVLLGGLAGCGSADTGKVTGRVTYNGEPVPSGTVVFLGEAGRSATGMIQDGTYTIKKAPLGQVRIGVKTFAPSPAVVPPNTPPKSIKQASLRYVPLPEKYHRPETSGLTYTVTPGEQTHDLTLTKGSK